MADVFKALADASRRRLLDRLHRRDGQTLGELCARASMTRFGVMKHLRVLERAGLVLARRSGREKLHSLNPMPIRLAHDRWVSKYRAPLALSHLKTSPEGPMAETQRYDLFIRTTPQKLWRALTDGEITRRSFFAGTVRSDWKRGSQRHSVGEKGKRDVEGKVIESDPPRLLVVGWHILHDEELAKERSRVSYLIEKRGRVCKLTVTHDCRGAPKTAAQVSREGWQLLLCGLKTLLETGEPMPMPSGAP
jgi:DNA-binding transcriptional ArsR family regulator